MASCLLGREHAGVDLLLDPGVVGGELVQLAVAEEIGPRVADVRDGEAAVVPGEGEGGEGGAHAGQRRVALGGLEDGAVGGGDGGAEAGVERGVDVRSSHLARQHLHRQPARHLACRVSAHPVGNAEESLLNVEKVRVLVLGTAEAGVGGRCR